MTTSDRALYNTRNAIVIIVAAIVLVAAALAVITPHQALADHGQVHRTDLAAEDACWVDDVNPETGRPIYAGPGCKKDAGERAMEYSILALVVGGIVVHLARESAHDRPQRRRPLAVFAWLVSEAVLTVILVLLTRAGEMDGGDAIQAGIWGTLGLIAFLGWLFRNPDAPKLHDSDGERFGPYTGGRY